jgi:hypothetical protein
VKCSGIKRSVKGEPLVLPLEFPRDFESASASDPCSLSHAAENEELLDVLEDV